MHNILRIKRIGYYQWPLTLDAQVRSGSYKLLMIDKSSPDQQKGTVKELSTLSLITFTLSVKIIKHHHHQEDLHMFQLSNTFELSSIRVNGRQLCNRQLRLRWRTRGGRNFYVVFTIILCALKLKEMSVTLLSELIQVSSQRYILGEAIWSWPAQVIPSHGNPQMRRTLLGGYLLKYCPVKHQTFHQVSEKTSQQTYSHQKTSIPDASKSHKTSTNLSDRAYFRQFSDW